MSTNPQPRDKRTGGKPPGEPAKKPSPAEDPGPNGNRPVHEVRMGRIVGAVWANTDKESGGVWYNVTFARIYRDQGGAWQRADSFGKSDLPLLVKVADRCHDWMFEQHAQADE